MDKNRKLKWIQPALICFTSAMILLNRFTEGILSTVALILGVVSLVVCIPITFILIGRMEDKDEKKE